MTREPDEKGVGDWKAWQVKLPENPEERLAGIGTWLLYCPGAHAAWSYWAAHLMHLRELPGLPPATRKYPEAEYELTVLALNPEFAPFDPDEPTTFRWLEPSDLVFQFHGVNDRDAERLLHAYVVRTMRGDVSPDTDFRSFWMQALQTKVECLRAGHHPEN